MKPQKKLIVSVVAMWSSARNVKDMTDAINIIGRLRRYAVRQTNRTSHELMFTILTQSKPSAEIRQLQSKTISAQFWEINGHRPKQEALPLPVVEIEKPAPVVICVPGTPFVKIELTRYDIDHRTPNYLKQSENEKRAQKAAKDKIPDEISRAEFRFFFPCPMSWDVKKRLQHDGKLHYGEPRLGKLIAAYSDALLHNSEIIAEVTGAKFWTNSEGYAEIIFLP